MKIRFEDGLKWLHWKEFYQVAEAMGVEILDKKAAREVMREKTGDTEGAPNIETLANDMASTAAGSLFRRDFDKMEEEIIAAYRSCTRVNRRRMDEIMAKIAKRAMKARKAESKAIVAAYNAAVASRDSIASNIVEAE